MGTFHMQASGTQFPQFVPIAQVYIDQLELIFQLHLQLWCTHYIIYIIYNIYTHNPIASMVWYHIVIF